MPNAEPPAYNLRMALTLVTPREPTPKETIIERLKAMPRPDGVLACPRCGGMMVLTTTSGAQIIKGRYQRGTVVDDRVCAECWKRGIFSPMMPGRVKPVK